MNKKTIRQLAFECLTAVLFNKQSLQQVLPIAKTKCHRHEDQALLQALCYGVLRYYPRLVWIARSILDKKIKPKDMQILPLIAMGLYQLMEMRTAEHAVIKETVEVTKLIKKPWWTGLVNAVLRTYQRKETEIIPPIPLNLSSEENNILELEAYYLHPVWFIDIIKKAWPKEWQQILTNNNVLPPFTLRVNQQKISCSAYLNLLHQHSIAAYSLEKEELNNAIIIEKPCDVQTLPGYSEGLFSVQDGAAQFAAKLLDLKPNQRVLDACAAPGVKTTHLFEIEPSLDVTAVDISKKRLDRLQENCFRLQVQPTLLLADVSNPASWWDGRCFDRILLDAPCSAAGVIRRHPDSKYLRTMDNLIQLSEQQYQILTAVWPLLKPGGSLLYVTCSILPIENQDVLNRFLTTQKDAYSISITLPFGINLPIGIQILPGQKNLDGFYYCLIGKHLA